MFPAAGHVRTIYERTRLVNTSERQHLDPPEEIDKALIGYINGLGDRGHFDAVQVAPGSSADVPDEAGGVRAVVLGVAHPHTGRDGSEALAEAKTILMQRGSTPRVYRNMLVFLAAEHRQLDNLRSAMRSLSPGRRSSRRPTASTSPRATAPRGSQAGGGERDAEDAPEGGLVLPAPVQDSAQADL